MKKIMFLSSLIGLSLLSTANATVYSMTAGHDGENRGSFNVPLVVTSMNDRWKVQEGSYQVRALGTNFSTVDVTRNYHIFNIPALDIKEIVTSVSLTVPHSKNSYDSPHETETYELFDIDSANFDAIRVKSTLTDERDLEILETIFADLGEGVSYGTVTSSLSDNSTYQTTIGSFTQALLDGLTAVGQNGGGDFGMGGSIISNTETGFGIAERIYRGTSNFDNLSTLEITTTVVPVPAAAWLFGTALLGLAGTSARRKSKLAI